MNKTLLATALVAVIAATAFAPTAQAANSGTITISGKVLSDTCTVSVNNGSTVALPTVMTASLGTVGATAGTTPFTIALSGCDANTTSAAMSFSGANIDAGTGNLKNTVAGGSNVQVQLLNGASVINASSGTNAPTITPLIFLLHVPSPDFIACFIPRILPTEAPIPAPTFPSAGALDEAETAA